MMTNTKLLEKITAQAENNNEVLREQLKEQILVGTKEMIEILLLCQNR